MNFSNNPSQTRRSNSASTRSTVSSVSTATAAAHAYDENVVPSGVDMTDQSAVMAGKVVGATRRSALSTVSVNANTTAAESNISQRNLRAKTAKQSSAATTTIPPAVPVVTVSASSSDDAEAVIDPEDKENIPAVVPVVFPVKTSLRSAPVDKENVAPLKQVIAAAVAIHDDLDSEDAGDPLMVSDYAIEIFDYMRKVEKTVMPKATYMAHQSELDWPMRTILIDWLIEMHWKLKLMPETLYLTVNIVDRFLSCRAVSLTKLQLVGLAAMLLASKYEEVIAPSINNLIFLADNSYKASELLNAERYILQILGFSLSYPSPMSFLRRTSKADNYDIRTRTLAKYLMEVALLDPSFVACPPSLLAAVSIYLSRLMLKAGPWNKNLIHYSGYDEFEVRRYSSRLLQFFQQPQEYAAVHRKYTLKKFMKASCFVHDWIKRHYPTAPSVNTAVPFFEATDA